MSSSTRPAGVGGKSAHHLVGDASDASGTAERLTASRQRHEGDGTFDMVGSGDLDAEEMEKMGPGPVVRKGRSLVVAVLRSTSYD